MKNKPNGFDLLTLLINLYADQEGVKITYELTDGEQDGGDATEGASVKAS